MGYKVKIIIDSAADIPTAWIDRYEIGVIPAYVILNQDSYKDDGIALPRAELYRRLEEPHIAASTSAPPPGDALSAFQAALQEAEQVVAFTVASTLSGIYNVFRLAAEQVDPKRITVCDSGSLTMGIGWQIWAAIQAREAGGGVAEMVAAAQSVRDRSAVWGIPATLDSLRRSGRISRLMAGIGTLLQIKPILEVGNNVVGLAQRARTMNKAISTLAEMVRSAAPLEYVAFIHIRNPEGAAALRSQLTDVLPTKPESVQVVEAAAAIAIHFGLDAVAAAIVRA